MPTFSALDPGARPIEPSPYQRVIPLTAPGGSGASPRFRMQGGEELDTERSTVLADTLESAESVRTDDASDSSGPSSEPRSQPLAGQTPKVDPMVTRTTLETGHPAQPAERALTAGSPADLRKHLVRSGEDFSSIAQHYYGSANLAGALWWANRGTVAWPGALVAGMRINVPPPERLQPRPGELGAGSRVILDTGSISWNPSDPASASQTGQNGSNPATASVQTSPASPASAPEAGYAIHVVRPSETLESIARDRLGDPRRAREIATLNQDLLSDTDRPKPGMRLLLPQLPDGR